MKYLFLLFITSSLFAQSSLDDLRWYLSPQGQSVLVAIDDLHDEELKASASLDWGRAMIPQIKLKKDIVIAVIDGGFDIEHPELKNHVAKNLAECNENGSLPPKDSEDKDLNGYKGDCSGWNFVEGNNQAEDLDGHGTHVTGIMNSMAKGISGSVKFLPLKVFAPQEGRSPVKGAPPLTTRLARAFEYAVLQKVDVIHLSVGWPKTYMSSELEKAIKKAQANKILIVSAAGNSSQRASIFPCQLEDVICVGALRANGEAARFSNWGTQVDILAPGEKILSTIPYVLNPLYISRKGYDYKNGTSQAAPFISLALGLLKGSFPEEEPRVLMARLFASSSLPSQKKALLGMFHLQKALELAPQSFLYPQMKGKVSLKINQSLEFSQNIILKNLWQESLPQELNLRCENAELANSHHTVAALASGETASISLSGRLNQRQRELNCELKTNQKTFSLNFKILESLPMAQEVLKARQDGYVLKTLSGTRSRLLTINALPGSLPGPIYYVSGMPEPVIYHLNEIKGTLKMNKDCRLLRLWQADINGDKENEIMMESMCEEKYLSYRFYDRDLKELFTPVKFKPTLTIVNYDNFELFPQKSGPPVFRFINVGYNQPSSSPWENKPVSRAPRLYELRPVMKGEEAEYESVLKEDPEKWQKSLKLRFMPEYYVMHLIGDRLLVKIGQRLAWVSIKDQEASWADLGSLLLEGTKKQEVLNSQESILQGFLTPYEYRGHILGQVSLKFKQSDRFDPLIDIIGTQKRSNGYLSILQSFQRLIFLEFDFSGNLIKRTDTIVDRFDFLASQDLLASVVNLKTDAGMFQLVDGSKLNTNYVDLIKNGDVRSFEIPMECATQVPVIVNDKPVLPVLCPLSREEFDMRLISL